MEKNEVTSKPKETKPTIVFEITREDEPKKIKGEISIEVTGKDDTPKVEHHNYWASIAVLSFIVYVASMFINGIVFLISFTVCCVSTIFAMDKAWELRRRSRGGWN